MVDLRARWSYRCLPMKILPFAIAGAITIAAFSSPAVSEAILLYLAYVGGPALVFSLVLIAVARRSLSKLQMMAVVVSSLLAYGAGEFLFFYLPLQFRFRSGAYLAPMLGAGIVLTSLVVIVGRRPRASRAVVLGSLLSLGSSVPWWLGEKVPAPGYFWWGVHVCLWYSLVGPFAVQILTGRYHGAKSEPGLATGPAPIRADG